MSGFGRALPLHKRTMSASEMRTALRKRCFQEQNSRFEWRWHAVNSCHLPAFVVCHWSVCAAALAAAVIVTAGAPSTSPCLRKTAFFSHYFSVHCAAVNAGDVQAHSGRSRRRPTILKCDIRVVAGCWYQECASRRHNAQVLLLDDRLANRRIQLALSRALVGPAQLTMVAAGHRSSSGAFV